MLRKTANYFTVELLGRLALPAVAALIAAVPAAYARASAVLTVAVAVDIPVGARIPSRFPVGARIHFARAWPKPWPLRPVT